MGCPQHLLIIEMTESDFFSKSQRLGMGQTSSTETRYQGSAIVHRSVIEDANRVVGCEHGDEAKIWAECLSHYTHVPSVIVTSSLGQHAAPH